MRAIRVVPNLKVGDLAAAKDFYAGFLGLTTEEFNLGWVARLASPDTGAVVQLVTEDATSPVDSNVSVHTSDVEAAYEEAKARGYEIVHPLTKEEWGVYRFLVRAPDGNSSTSSRTVSGDAWQALADPFVDGAYATVKGQVRTYVLHQQLMQHLPAPPADILDVGGGAAHQSLPLARLGHRVTVLDPSAAMLAKAEERVAAEPVEVRERVRLVHARGEDAVRRSTGTASPRCCVTAS